MYSKYYSIKSCYERENKETKQNEVVVIASEIKGKWLISTYSRYFVMTPEEFVAKFKSKIKNDAYNKWLERVNFEWECEEICNIKWVCENLPEKYQ